MRRLSGPTLAFFESDPAVAGSFGPIALLEESNELLCPDHLSLFFLFQKKKEKTNDAIKLCLVSKRNSSSMNRIVFSFLLKRKKERLAFSQGLKTLRSLLKTNDHPFLFFFSFGKRKALDRVTVRSVFEEDQARSLFSFNQKKK